MSQNPNSMLPIVGAMRAEVRCVSPLRVRVAEAVVDAHVASPMYTPRVGDRVLVARDETGAVHVIGIISAPGAPRLRDRGEGHALVTNAPLAIQGPALDVVIERASLRAEQLESAVGRARHRVRVLEVRAERILETARDVYREVEELSQLRAGRLRMVARGALSLVGESALMRARRTMKLRGRRIHLA